jgi:hypothetical protein
VVLEPLLKEGVRCWEAPGRERGFLAADEWEKLGAAKAVQPAGKPSQVVLDSRPSYAIQAIIVLSAQRAVLEYQLEVQELTGGASGQLVL